MTRHLILAGMIALAAWGCKNDPASAEAATEVTPSEPQDIRFALHCADISQPGDKTPHHDVYAIAGKDTAKVGTIEVCDHIPKEEYAKYEIPADAYDAVGGTSDGKTTFIVYLAKSPEGKVQARMGDMYPGKQGGFTYRTLVVFTDEDLNPSASLSPGEMVGSYALSGQDKSYVLYVGFSERNMVAQAFTINGPLPQDDAAIMAAVGKGTPEFIPSIVVDFSTYEFSSSKGAGKFNVAGSKVQSVTFANWDNKELTLEKRDIGAVQGK